VATNKILSALLSIVAIVVIPVQMVTTFILGLLVSVSFGALLFPISFIWMVLFYMPLIGLSYVYEHVSVLKLPVAIVGIPLALLADIYVALMPSMGEVDSRYQKMVVCQVFPYTWRLLQVQKQKIDIKKGDVLFRILEDIAKLEPLKTHLKPLFVDIYSRQSFINKP
jgi:hypothetical protein